MLDKARRRRKAMTGKNSILCVLPQTSAVACTLLSRCGGMPMTRRAFVAGFSLMLLVQSPAYADEATGPTGVTLYEVSERVTFDPDPSAIGVIRRNATSPLQGFAALGTPLCPSK